MPMADRKTKRAWARSNANTKSPLKALQTKGGKREFGAGDESRTRDLNLGKVALYQLSYSRSENPHFTQSPHIVKSHCTRQSLRFKALSDCLVRIKKGAFSF